MGLLRRIQDLFDVKVKKTLDRMEDPKEVLDYSLAEMEDGLRKLSQNAVEIGTAKKKLEMQRDTLRNTCALYEDQAQQALEFGQEKLAKEAIIRKMEIEPQIKAIEKRITEVEQNLQLLAENKEKMKHNIQSFKIKKEELKATYSASQAQLKVKEMLTSLGSETETVGQTIARAEARIEDMRAKVGAIDELVDQGIITEVLANENDSIDQKLKKLSLDRAVEQELARLKATEPVEISSQTDRNNEA